MSVDVNNNISNNVLPNGTNSDTDGGYDKIDTPQPSNSNTQTHLEVIKGLTSVTDIQNYIGQNVIAPLKSETPPNLSGVDRALVDLIATSANANPQLSAVLYHTIKDNLGYKLNIENQTETGQRKIILNGSGKNITDSHYIQLAKADSDLNAYHNDYFETLGVAPTPQVPITPVSTATVPATQTPTAATAPTTITETPSTDVSAEQDFDDIEQETPIIPNFSEKFLNLLPVDADLSDFDEVLIIDTKTGKEIKPKKYDLNDPKEAAELEELMARSITIQTNGKNEAVTDDTNMQKIADALAEYITKPYETRISPDGLEEILDNFSLEASSEIFNLVQDQIIQSGNPAHIMKLKNYKNKHSDNGLDGIIGEMYNFNYLGGNNGNPLLFLSDIFANDTTYKLQSTNIDKIATVLGEHTKEYLSSMDSDDPEDIRKNQSSFAFISQTISLLSNSNPENQSQGNIDKLLQAVMAKSGDNIAAKDILTDLAANAGIETFKTVSIQTGQSLMSNFGEFTYTDANGNAKTFSSTETTGNFENFKTDITALLNGTHASILSSVDKSNLQGDAEAKAMTASQAADAIAMLSLEQQTAIIKGLSEEDLDNLEVANAFLTTPNENLMNIINKIKTNDIIKDLKVEGIPAAKAIIFAEAIETFTDKASPQEMTVFISQIIQDGTGFLDLEASSYSEFIASLKTELAKIEGLDVELVTKNLTNALNVNNVEFKNNISTDSTSTDSTSTDSTTPPALSATSLENTKDIYIDAIEAGTLNVDQAKAFLNSLTPQEKADPTFWDDILGDRTFATEDEFKNFMKSINNISGEMSISTDDMTALKTNLANSLKTLNPEFATGATPPSTPVISEPKTYMDHIINLEKDDDNDGIDDYNITEKLDIELDFATKLKWNEGKIEETANSFGKYINHETSNEDLALYAQSMVNYVLDEYSDLNITDKSIKLYEMMDIIAPKLNKGSDKLRKSDSDSQMTDFLKIMAATLKGHSDTFDIPAIGQHIYDDTHLETHIYADRIYGRGKKNRDDRHAFLKDTFINVANGTEAYTMPIVTAPPAPDTTTEEQVDDGSLEGGS